MQFESITSMDANFTENKILTTQKSIKLYTVQNEALVLYSELVSSNKEPISAAQFISKTDNIAAITLDGTLCIFQESLKTLEKKVINGPIDALTAFKHENANIYSIILGCNGGYLKNVTFDGVSLSEPVNLPLSHRHGVVALSSNNKVVASIGEDRFLFLFSINISNNNVECSKLYEQKFEKDLKDVCVARDDVFENVLFSICVEDEVLVYFSSLDSIDFENVQKIDVKGCNSIKWTKSGYCLVVGTENGFRSFAPDDDGKYVEIDVEKL
ncbi:hypothetical protein EDEG_03433 [Edhazardia aedis USNM 41457]|uniref:Anaphase-promoting complex subunit 4 WD40 domain-containing protein n=1 Tax=Edhazardia aedis (strain USNM 41457) TaxID=1003232 RepID=J9DHN1_EDHAE|nr:hypothetical protein EDEG_03433 [Edhazardia aedis USNM 41457]|eukprot:EJW02115.1 hypothetical protein EDEG_03433 [Edhazardia aedis USNM 41457]